MHVHILGICGTFMGGVAVLARQAGHRVTGSDQHVYPPMSTQLESLGIGLHEGYDAAALQPAPDSVVVGNVMSRGSPVVEHLLDSGLPYSSGPQWLAEHVLAGRHVLAVAGTHGKTSTASMLAWILDYAGLEPGFLIGGVPVDFGVSARLGESEYFVVEADEYDTAFFDKRSKFVHYRPATLVLTNLEFDHADIFADLAAIRTQFHHLLRTVPRRGTVIAHAASGELDKVLAMGCWSQLLRYGDDGDWTVQRNGDRLEIRLHAGDKAVSAAGEFGWPGIHNAHNALAACAAARDVGVPLETSLEALSRWRGVRRRLEVAGTVAGITVYDDFAHHPTEIAATLEALGGTGRVVAVLEPRSNSMKSGAHADTLAASLAAADGVFIFRPPGLEWNLEAAVKTLRSPVTISEKLDSLIESICSFARAGDRIAVMSNGGFGGLPGRLVAALQAR